MIGSVQNRSQIISPSMSAPRAPEPHLQENRFGPLISWEPLGNNGEKGTLYTFGMQPHEIEHEGEKVTLHGREIHIWAPKGFDLEQHMRRDAPDPDLNVLYAHDGKSLFKPGGCPFGPGHWDLGGAMQKIADGGNHKPTIVVALDQISPEQNEQDKDKIDALKNVRFQEYTPNAFNSSGLLKNLPTYGDHYIDFIEDVLDKHITDVFKAGGSRAMLGSSMGGLITLHAAARKPDSIWKSIICMSPELRIYTGDSSMIKHGIVSHLADKRNTALSERDTAKAIINLSKKLVPLLGNLEGKMAVFDHANDARDECPYDIYIGQTVDNVARAVDQVGAKVKYMVHDLGTHHNEETWAKFVGDHLVDALERRSPRDEQNAEIQLLGAQRLYA